VICIELSFINVKEHIDSLCAMYRAVRLQNSVMLQTAVLAKVMTELNINCTYAHDLLQNVVSVSFTK